MVCNVVSCNWLIMIKSFVHTVTGRRKQFLETLPESNGHIFTVKRSNIFDDIVNLYRKEAANLLAMSPVQLEYEGERALDTGGVMRDVFSAFWEEAIPRLFDGGSAVIPALTPHSEMILYSIVGTVLSHGFLEAGFLPLRVAFPVIACAIKGPLTEIPDTLLLDSFLNYISAYEADFVRQGLKSCNFSDDLQEALTTLLSRFHCMKMPSPSNLRVLLIQVARHEMVTVPMKVLHYMHSGVPVSYREFWESFSVLELYSVFNSINASPEQLIKSIANKPEDLSPAQSRVFNFLLSYIGNMKTNEEAHQFLRFVTGSSVAIGKSITITFNGTDGAAKQPIAHTCPCELELSVNYATSIEFATDFKRILASEWSMTMDNY